MKAFTLMELLVAMALMAILSVLSFYAFELVQQQYLLHKKIGEEVVTYQTFIALIQKDIQAAQYVERQANQLILKNQEINISYFFQDSTVERIHAVMPNKVDTIFVQVAWEEAYLNNRWQEVGLIDQGQLKLQAFGEQQIFPFSKSYSSIDLMQY